MFEELKKYVATKTYSLTAGHTQMVSHMADEITAREGKFVSDGEIVRRAIDLFWDKVYAEKPAKATKKA